MCSTQRLTKRGVGAASEQKTILGRSESKAKGDQVEYARESARSQSDVSELVMRHVSRRSSYETYSIAHSPQSSVSDFVEAQHPLSKPIVEHRRDENVGESS